MFQLNISILCQRYNICSVHYLSLHVCIHIVRLAEWVGIGDQHGRFLSRALLLSINNRDCSPHIDVPTSHGWLWHCASYHSFRSFPTEALPSVGILLLSRMKEREREREKFNDNNNNMLPKYTLDCTTTNY